jgi:SAM-dependent methyltransferase
VNIRSLQKVLAKSDVLRGGYRICVEIKEQFSTNVFAMIPRLWRFRKEYGRFQRQSSNPNFEMSFKYIYPCLKDNIDTTPIDPIYFYQDSWAARKIFDLKPSHHYDVGSSVKTMGIISQFVPTTMIDIRPPDVKLQNLLFTQGSILQLPFESESIESLSSICVLEHIGLGRYGDPIDPWGSEKSCAELRRVLKPNGNLLISVPVDAQCCVYFNAHRAFTRDYVLKLFPDCTLVEELYIYGTKLVNQYDPMKGFGTGLYHFRKGLNAR